MYFLDISKDFCYGGKTMHCHGVCFDMFCWRKNELKCSVFLTKEKWASLYNATY